MCGLRTMLAWASPALQRPHTARFVCHGPPAQTFSSDPYLDRSSGLPGVPVDRGASAPDLQARNRRKKCEFPHFPPKVHFQPKSSAFRLAPPANRGVAPTKVRENVLNFHILPPCMAWSKTSQIFEKLSLRAEYGVLDPLTNSAEKIHRM